LIRLIQEIIILAMETVGMVFVSLGLGLAAAWWAGPAGLFLVTGLCLVAGAGVAAYQQRSNLKQQRPGGKTP
jgi:hypothetical protein